MSTVNFSQDKYLRDTETSGFPGSDLKPQPVMKLSFGGFLLFANAPGVEFLDVLADYTKKPALTYLVKKFPDMLKHDSNMDICIQLYETCFYFSVVAFKEDGYIGVYGYKSVRNHCGGSMVA